jgi:hypothetical protein
LRRKISRWWLKDDDPRDDGYKNSLLRAGITYDPQQAGDYVKTKLLSLLPER